MGFLKSPEIPLEGLIKIPLEGNFFRFSREEEKTRTRAVGFLKSPEIPLEDTYFTPLHVADWPGVQVTVYKEQQVRVRLPKDSSAATHEGQCTLEIIYMVTLSSFHLEHITYCFTKKCDPGYRSSAYLLHV